MDLTALSNVLTPAPLTPFVVGGYYQYNLAVIRITYDSMLDEDPDQRLGHFEYRVLFNPFSKGPDVGEREERRYIHPVDVRFARAQAAEAIASYRTAIAHVEQDLARVIADENRI